ncbi:tetratricopeptide repeat protein, partial [Aureimonas pseudogalii]
IAAQRQALFAQMLADPSDLDAAFRYAALSAEAGDLEGAIATLERMLIFAPGLPRLQLELGVLYFRLGAYDTARTYLEGALSSPETPDEVRERVRPFLAAVEDRSSLQSLSGAVLLGGRYQSNANAAPESRTVNLNGIDFLLGDAAIRSADVNGFASGTLRYVHALPGQGDRFEVNLQSYGALYAERRELDTILGEVTAGPVFDLRRWRFEGTYLGVYAILGGVMLDADPYLVSGGVGTSLAKTFDPATQGLLRAEYRREEFRDSALRPTASSRTGDRYSLSGLLEHRLSDTLSVFAIG